MYPPVCWADKVEFSNRRAVSARGRGARNVIKTAGYERIRGLGDAWRHMVGNLVAVVLALANLWLRANNGDEVVLPWGLLISAVIVLLIRYTGWKGGELSYRHRVGMLPDDKGR